MNQTRHIGPPLRLLLVWLAILGSSSGGAAPEDPYGSISVHTLENGMTLVIAPSDVAKTVVVELRVLAGWNGEQRWEQGAARVASRALFRDPGLPFQQTYLQRIREAGGQARARVTVDHTAFSATVPSIRGPWVLNEMATMVLGRKLDPEAVEKAKEETLLELGQPDNFLQSLFGRLLLGTETEVSMLESEFGIPDRESMDLGKLRTSVAGMPAETVQKFYERYYVPNNMVLFVSGPFKKEATLDFIQDTYGPFPAILPFVFLEDPREVTPRREAYVRSRVATGNARVDLGTKFWNIDAKDEVVLKTYFEYLAHRVSDRLRSQFGERFVARPEIQVYPRRFGYARLRFDVPPSHYASMLDFARDLVHRETIAGIFTDEAIREARNHYRRHAELIPDDTATMAELSAQLYAFQSKYGIQSTPYEVLMDMSNEEFREHLRGLFHPRKELLAVEPPPLLFRGEMFLLYLLALALSVLVCRRLYLKPFGYTSIRYVRKIKYQPLVVTVLATLYLNLLWGASELTAVAERLLLNFQLIQSNFITGQYLPRMVTIFVMITGSISYLCLLPRKLIVTRTHLHIKSLSYAARKVDILSVRDVTVCRPFQLFAHKLWRWNLRMVHWTPWKKGILIRLDDGSAYFLGFSDAEKVAAELRTVFTTTKPEYDEHYHDVA